MEFTPPAVEVGSLHHWTPGEFPVWLLLLTFSSRSQAVSGPRGETVDKHRRQDHGHHGQGVEAPPPLRAGRGADSHLHAHEEGRQGQPSVRPEVLPSPDAGEAGSAWRWPEGLPSPDAGEGGARGGGVAAVGC